MAMYYRRHLQDQVFDYDGWGNFKQKRGLATTATTPKMCTAYKVSTRRPTKGAQYYTFDYDANGNVIGDGTRQFEYASFDKPVMMSYNNGSANPPWPMG